MLEKAIGAQERMPEERIFPNSFTAGISFTIDGILHHVDFGNWKNADFELILTIF